MFWVVLDYCNISIYLFTRSTFSFALWMHLARFHGERKKKPISIRTMKKKSLVLISLYNHDASWYWTVCETELCNLWAQSYCCPFIVCVKLLVFYCCRHHSATIKPTPKVFNGQLRLCASHWYLQTDYCTLLLSRWYTMAICLYA